MCTWAHPFPGNIPPYQAVPYSPALDDNAHGEAQFPPSRSGRSDRGHGQTGSVYSDFDGPEPSRASGPVRNRASTRQSTVHPDDSVSNGRYRQHRPRESDARGRSRAPNDDRRQLPFDGYPPARPSDSGYTSASRYRESDTRGRSRAPANNRHRAPRGGYPPTMPGDSSYSSRSRSVAHTHARQDLCSIYTYQPAAEHRSRRSRAPTPDYRAASGAHRYSTSSLSESGRTTAGSRYSL